MVLWRMACLGASWNGALQDDMPESAYWRGFQANMP